jgi:hypothetical protein
MIVRAWTLSQGPNQLECCDRAAGIDRIVELSTRMDYDEIMFMDELESLRGQQVEVIYNALSYRGELAGASDTEIYLKTSTDWITLPMEGITTVRKVETP